MKSTMVLKDTPFAAVKREAWEQARETYLLKYGKRLTQDMVHVRTGIPLSNVNRYFNDPEYNPSPENLAHVCGAMENWLMIDWIAAQCGGFFIQRTDARMGKQETITTSVNKIQRGASDLLSSTLEALKDGNISMDEIRALVGHFRQVATMAEEGLLAAESAGKQ